MDLLPVIIFAVPIAIFFSTAMWSSQSSSTIAQEHRHNVREVRERILRERIQIQQQRGRGTQNIPPPAPSAPPASPPPSAIPYPEGLSSPSSSSLPRPAPTAPPAERVPSSDCPICLEHASFAVETNCAHLYCAECFLEYHERGGGGSSLVLQPVVCPCCRRRVDALITRFTRQEETSEDMGPLLHKVQGYNSRFSSQPRSLLESWNDTPTYLRRFINELSTSPWGVVMMLVRSHFLLSLLGGLLYVVSPIDLLPELVMGVLGLVDDAMAILIVCVVLASIYRTATVQRVAAQRG